MRYAYKYIVGTFIAAPLLMVFAVLFLAVTYICCFIVGGKALADSSISALAAGKAATMKYLHTHR